MAFTKDFDPFFYKSIIRADSIKRGVGLPRAQEIL